MYSRTPKARIGLLAVCALLVLLFLAACNRIGTPEGWSGGAISGDTLYIGTSEGEVRAIERASGATRWRFGLQGEERYRAVYGTPFIAEDTLYFGGYDNVLYALSLDGQELWVEPLGDAIVGGPTVSGNHVLVGSSDGNMYALDADEGTEQWRFQTGGKVWSTPAIANGIAYFGSLDHKVYAVSLREGEEQWNFPTGGAVASSPIVANGRVYVGAFDSVFYAIDAATGNEIWSFDGATNWYWARAVIHADMILAPSLDGSLYALSVNTGGLLWKVDTDGPLVGSPAVVSDSMIALASSDGKIRLIGLDGSVLDACNVNEEIRTSIVAQDDFVYFGARDHSIRALQIKSNGNPDEEWVHFTDQDSPTQRGQPAAC